MPRPSTNPLNSASESSSEEDITRGLLSPEIDASSIPGYYPNPGLQRHSDRSGDFTLNSSSNSSVLELPILPEHNHDAFIQWALWVGKGFLGMAITITGGVLFILFGLHKDIANTIKNALLSVSDSELHQHIHDFALFICKKIHQYLPGISIQSCIPDIIPEIENITSQAVQGLKEMSPEELNPAVSLFSMTLIEIFILGAISATACIGVVSLCCSLYNNCRKPNSNSAPEPDSPGSPRRGPTAV